MDYPDILKVVHKTGSNSIPISVIWYLLAESAIWLCKLIPHEQCYLNAHPTGCGGVAIRCWGSLVCYANGSPHPGENISTFGVDIFNAPISLVLINDIYNVVRLEC